MSVEQTNKDLKSFHQFVGEQIAKGAQLAPDEVLAMWRQHADSLNAIREGLEAANAGRTKPLVEFVRNFERRHNIAEIAEEE